MALLPPSYLKHTQGTHDTQFHAVVRALHTYTPHNTVSGDASLSLCVPVPLTHWPSPGQLSQMHRDLYGASDCCGTRGHAWAMFRAPLTRAQSVFAEAMSAPSRDIYK